MLLAIAPEKIPVVIAIAAVLLIHYPLAVIATGRILKYKAKGLPDWIWHLIIQLLFIIGPTVFILLHRAGNSQIRVYKRFEEAKAKALAEREVRQAAAYFMRVRTSYSSGGRSFACQPFNVFTAFDQLRAMSTRLANVIIENQSFETLIPHYDRENTFFYGDPPYFSSEYVYDADFDWEHHVLLRDTLAKCKGEWLISQADFPECRNCGNGERAFVDDERRRFPAARQIGTPDFPEGNGGKFLSPEQGLLPAFLAERNVALTDEAAFGIGEKRTVTEKKERGHGFLVLARRP